jgi:hypothetical protein
MSAVLKEIGPNKWARITNNGNTEVSVYEVDSGGVPQRIMRVPPSKQWDIQNPHDHQMKIQCEDNGEVEIEVFDTDWA